MISIHALREEGDLDVRLADTSNTYISIHALREEGDQSWQMPPRRPSNFYPRPPRGGRREIYIQYRTGKIFLSTPSARRATLTLKRPA